MFVASAQFRENAELFKNDKEKHNLYSGLANLAAAVERIESQLQKLANPPPKMDFGLGPKG